MEGTVQQERGNVAWWLLLLLNISIFAVIALNTHQPEIKLASPADTFLGDPTVISHIQTPAEFHEALELQRCLIYFHSGLSGDCLRSSLAFHSFHDVWNQPDGKPLYFRFIDFSNPQGELWEAVEKWMNSQSIPPGGMKNWGSIGKVVWVKRGTVQHFRWSIGDVPLEELTTLSKEHLY